MKKLFLFSVAALAFCACSSDEVVSENSAANQQPKEISFFALNKGATRAAITDAVFPTTLGMKVSALDLTNHRKFFDETAFSHGTTYWEGSPKRYWPLSPVQINFLAIANANSNNTDGVTWTTTGTASSEAQSVQVVMADNYAASTAQKDFIYAIGNGQVTQNGNALSFPEKVDMVFKHTQAYLVFRVKAADEASENIAIKDIQIQGARTSGTATIARVNPATYANAAVNLNWTATGYPGGGAATGYNSVTPTQVAYSPAVALDDAGFVERGYLLVVPYMTAANTFAEGGFTTFKIIYTLDNNEYEYVYTPTTTKLEAGKKYTYDITFKLHEIFIDPSVTDWEETTTNIYLPSVAYNESGATVSIGKTAGTYTFDISNVPAGTYTIAEGTTGTDFIESVGITDNSSTNGSVTITVVSNGGTDDTTRPIILKNSGTDKMTITVKLSDTAVDA